MNPNVWNIKEILSIPVSRNNASTSGYSSSTDSQFMPGSQGLLGPRTQSQDSQETLFSRNSQQSSEGSDPKYLINYYHTKPLLFGVDGKDVHKRAIGVLDNKFEEDKRRAKERRESDFLAKERLHLRETLNHMQHSVNDTEKNTAACKTILEGFDSFSTALQKNLSSLHNDIAQQFEEMLSQMSSQKQLLTDIEENVLKTGEASTEIGSRVKGLEKNAEEAVTLLNTLVSKHSTKPIPVRVTDSAIQTSPGLTDSAIQKAPDLTDSAIQTSPGLTVSTIQKAPDLTDSTIQTSPDLTDSTIQTSPGLTVSTIQKAPDLTDSAIQTSPDLTDSTIQKAPDLTDSTIQTSPDLTDSTIQTSPGLTVSTIQTSPGLTVSTIQTSPGLTVSTIQKAPDLTDSAIQTSPDLTDSTIQTSPGLTVSTIQKAPDLTDSAIQTSPGLTDSTIQTSPGLTVSAIQKSPDLTVITIQTSPGLTQTLFNQEQKSQPEDKWLPLSQIENSQGEVPPSQNQGSCIRVKSRPTARRRKMNKKRPLLLPQRRKGTIWYENSQTPTYNINLQGVSSAHDPKGLVSKKPDSQLKSVVQGLEPEPRSESLINVKPDRQLNRLVNVKPAPQSQSRETRSNVGKGCFITPFNLWSQGSSSSPAAIETVLDKLPAETKAGISETPKGLWQLFDFGHSDPFSADEE